MILLDDREMRTAEESVFVQRAVKLVSCTDGSALQMSQENAVQVDAFGINQKAK